MKDHVHGNLQKNPNDQGEYCPLSDAVCCLPLSSVNIIPIIAFGVCSSKQKASARQRSGSPLSSFSQTDPKPDPSLPKHGPATGLHRETDFVHLIHLARPHRWLDPTRQRQLSFTWTAHEDHGRDQHKHDTGGMDEVISSARYSFRLLPNSPSFFCQRTFPGPCPISPQPLPQIHATRIASWRLQEEPHVVTPCSSLSMSRSAAWSALHSTGLSGSRRVVARKRRIHRRQKRVTDESRSITQHVSTALPEPLPTVFSNEGDATGPESAKLGRE